MKKVTYFPGCSAHGTSKEFEHTVNVCMDTLGVEVQEIKDWNCCGATSAHAMTHTLAMALPLRNLILAQELNNSTMAIPCASCYARHKIVKHDLDANEELAKEIGSTIDEGTYKGGVEVKSMLQFCYEDIGLDAIKAKVKKPLSGLKVACYYGCLLTRPANITQFDSPEYPMSMDKIMEALGATPVDFDFKTECCGASFSISETDVVNKLSGKILEMAKQSEADLIVVACPLCQSNLDMRQAGIEKILDKKLDIPVLYFTQLMAMAFGHPEPDMMFSKHIVKVDDALNWIGKRVIEDPKAKKKVVKKSEENIEEGEE